MKIIGFDLETTGFLEEGHRIVEIWAGLWSLEKRRLEGQLHYRIDPCRAMPAEAQRVHGITGADLIGKPRFEDVAPHIGAFFRAAELIVGHNVGTFDLPFLNMELRRAGHPEIATHAVDTARDARWATPTGKVPSLAELSFACGIDYDTDKAHGAEYDVEVLMASFFKGVDFGRFNLDETSK